MKSVLKGFILFFLVAAGIFWGVLFFFLKAAPEKKTLLATLKPVAAGVTESQAPLIPTPKSRTNVILLGVDTLNKKKVARTDTIMILSVDPESHSSFILSVPRDTMVQLKGSREKINAAHVYGGIPLTVEALQNLLSIPLHHYILVDYRALEKTVEDVGGVEIDVPMDMRYSDPKADPPLKINLKKGLQVLNGEKSMEFLRYRKGYADQDIGRIKSQQYFMQQLANKVLSPASIPKIPNFISTLIDYVETDMNKLELLALSKDFMDMGNLNIRKETIPGEAKTVDGLSYYVVNKSELAILEESLLTASSLSFQAPSSGAPVSSAPPQDNLALDGAKVLILNGSGKTGVAKSASDLLLQSQRLQITTGNAHEYTYEKTRIYYKNSEMGAQFLSSLLKAGIPMEGIPQDSIPKGSISKEKTAALDFVIILGKDY